MTRARSPRPYEIAQAAHDPRLHEARRAESWQRSDGWRARGECSKPGVNAEWWFALPTEVHEQQVALKACGRCPVSGTCLQWALDTGDQVAIAGATDPTERRAMLVAWRNRAAAKSA